MASNKTVGYLDLKKNKIKTIVSLGPSTNTEEDLRKLKDKGVDFVRINMSHSGIEDLKYFIKLAKQNSIPFILDTEGSQVRTGGVKDGQVFLEEGKVIRIHPGPVIGGKTKVSLKPASVVEKLEVGDLLLLGPNNLVLKISDTSSIKKGYITGKVIIKGDLGSDKAVVIKSWMGRELFLPTLSEKDCHSILIGLAEGIHYIAISFTRGGYDIDRVVKATKGKMKIISKVECKLGLKNIDDIIKKSDYILIDRGDLGKEIHIERLPFTQKIIIEKARKRKKGVFVATNLLETMVGEIKPSRAEINDIINTILDGADGLTLAAETAIGKFPMECINTLNRIIKHAESYIDKDNKGKRLWTNKGFHLDEVDYFTNFEKSESLVPPNGGKLINRILGQAPGKKYLESLYKVPVDINTQMDIEQIAIGVYSPLEGFMEEPDFKSVLDQMRLVDGKIFPIPVFLDVAEDVGDKITVPSTISLTDVSGEVIALMHVSDKYRVNREKAVVKLFGTDSHDHPGVRMFKKLNPVFLGGKIDLLKRRSYKFKEYELTPSQVRILFNEKGWEKVVGFHSRNVIHRVHEFVQLKALRDECCDGLFVHPIIGKKKEGDFMPEYIIKSYEKMLSDFYPVGKVVFSVFSSYSRYAGPREAVFTAICRQNFGCSHFIVGRDHTGVSYFYKPDASQKIFDKFPDLEIKIIKFGEVFYSQKLKRFRTSEDGKRISKKDKVSICGTDIRNMLQNFKQPPDFVMRKEISSFLIESLKSGKEVFVPKLKKGKVLWFTGLSGAGKTTISLELKNRLEKLGKAVEVLDGDVVRSARKKKLGFSRTDIQKNNRIIAGMAKKALSQYDFILVPIISPFQEDRVMAEKIIGNGFIEVFINCPLEKCIERDVKGIYSKFLAGKIKNVIGTTKESPYEPPSQPDIEINTGVINIDKSVQRIIQHLEEQKLS